MAPRRSSRLPPEWFRPVKPPFRKPGAIHCESRISGGTIASVTSQPPAPESPPPARRRLESPKPNTEGRTGCIITGAVLGIIFGATFAFYGLPPILRSIYGEEKVAAGEVYRGDGREMHVEFVLIEPPGVTVGLSVLTNKTWRVTTSDFTLELADRDDWVEARPPDPGRPETQLNFRLGQRQEVVLVFETDPGDGVPEALHVSDPRIRLALPPPEKP
jgi:hypothetical protein